MNRRKLFSFLAASPVGVVAAVAQAKQPAVISADRIDVGSDFEIVAQHDGSVKIGRKVAKDCQIIFYPRS